MADCTETPYQDQADHGLNLQPSEQQLSSLQAIGPPTHALQRLDVCMGGCRSCVGSSPAWLSNGGGRCELAGCLAGWACRGAVRASESMCGACVVHMGGVAALVGWLLRRPGVVLQGLVGLGVGDPAQAVTCMWGPLWWCAWHIFLLGSVLFGQMPGVQPQSTWLQSWSWWHFTELSLINCRSAIPAVARHHASHRNAAYMKLIDIALHSQ